jgi:hypothetical protein
MVAKACAIRRPGCANIAKPTKHAVNQPAALKFRILIAFTPTLSLHSSPSAACCKHVTFNFGNAANSFHANRR